MTLFPIYMRRGSAFFSSKQLMKVTVFKLSLYSDILSSKVLCSTSNTLLAANYQIENYQLECQGFDCTMINGAHNMTLVTEKSGSIFWINYD